MRQDLTPPTRGLTPDVGLLDPGARDHMTRLCPPGTSPGMYVDLLMGGHQSQDLLDPDPLAEGLWPREH